MPLCEIILKATSFKSKNPKVKIYNNDNLLGDIECSNSITTFSYNIIPNEKNILSIEFYNKSFGDNYVWDTDDKDDLKLEVLDIKFDDVSIGHLLSTTVFTTNWTARQLELQPPEFINQYSKFISGGNMSFNGVLEFPWEMPLYDFLIEKKFKQSYDSSVAYYSNNTALFHYEQGERHLKEIKNLIRQHGQ